LPSSLDAAENRHGDIRNYQVRLQFQPHFHDSLAVVHSSNNLKRESDQFRDYLPNARVIICHKNARFGYRSCSLSVVSELAWPEQSCCRVNWVFVPIAEDGATLGLEPLVLCAHTFKSYEMPSPPVKDPAYTFLKQNEANPQNQYYSCQSCEYEQHSQEFLHRVKVHFKPLRVPMDLRSVTTKAQCVPRRSTIRHRPNSLSRPVNRRTVSSFCLAFRA
jgi:hypothetical protein